MSSLPRITWGLHEPNHSTASQHTRLRCALIDLIQSRALPTLEHTPGPYFDSPTGTFRVAQPIEIIFDRTNHLPSILTSYNLDKSQITHIRFQLRTLVFQPTPTHNHYGIHAGMEALTTEGAPAMAVTEDGTMAAISSWMTFEWPAARGARDVVPGLSWECVVRLLHVHSMIETNGDGTDVSRSERERRNEQAACASRLLDLGYKGWPGFVTGNGQVDFRRV